MTDLAAGGKGAWNAADRKQKEREKDGWNATGEEQKKKKENFRNSIVKEQICGTMQKGMEQKKAALSQDETKESNTDEFCFAAGFTGGADGKVTGIQRCVRRTSYMRWGMGENHDIKNNAEHFACIILRKH